jgi:hypothetical protein
MAVRVGLRLATAVVTSHGNLSGGQVSVFLCRFYVFQQRFAKRTLAYNQQNDTSDTAAKDDNNNNNNDNDKQPSTNQPNQAKPTTNNQPNQQQQHHPSSHSNVGAFTSYEHS